MIDKYTYIMTFVIVLAHSNILRRKRRGMQPIEIQQENAVRWQIEQMHRELKQLTGTEKCECRSQRAQRNHLACCYQAWLAIKVKAKQLEKTLYAVVKDLFSDYLRAELRNPRIPALLAA